MADIAEQIFVPVRRRPEGVGGLADHVNSPAFATSVGLCAYARPATGPTRGGCTIGITGRIRTVQKFSTAADRQKEIHGRDQQIPDKLRLLLDEEATRAGAKIR
jgi:cell division ATPase FtsA